jgi:hypothetical protein
MLTICLSSIVFYNKVRLSVLFVMHVDQLIHETQIVVKRSHIHGISIGIPLLLACLLWTTNTWGVEGKGRYTLLGCPIEPGSLNVAGSGAQPCSFGGPFYAGIIWHDVTYNGLLMLNCAIMLLLLMKLLYLEFADSPKVSIETIRVAFHLSAYNDIVYCCRCRCRHIVSLARPSFIIRSPS